MPDDWVIIKEGKKAEFRVPYDETVLIREEQAVFDRHREDILYFFEGPKDLTLGSGVSGTLGGGGSGGGGQPDCGTPDTIQATVFTPLTIAFFHNQASTQTGPATVMAALRSLGHTVDFYADTAVFVWNDTSYDVAITSWINAAYHVQVFTKLIQGGTPTLVGFRQGAGIGNQNSPLSRSGGLHIFPSTTSGQIVALSESLAYNANVVANATHPITSVYSNGETVEITPNGRGASYVNTLTGYVGTLILTEDPDETGAGQPAAVAISAGSLNIAGTTLAAKVVGWSGIWGSDSPFSNVGAKLMDRMLWWLNT